jgi:uncharacterized protein
MFETIRERHAAGRIMAITSAQKPIRFFSDDRAAAEEAFGVHPGCITDRQRIAFGGFILNRCCELAAELDIPLQLHAGPGSLVGAEPVRLEPVFQRHPRTRFVLCLAGSLWIRQAAGLVHAYPNVSPSLARMPIACTAAAVRALHDFIDVAPSVNTIAWGSGCRIAEESVGALLAWRHVVATVLAERVADGRLRPADANVLARKFMFENGWRVYMHM